MTKCKNGVLTLCVVCMLSLAATVVSAQVDNKAENGSRPNMERAIEHRKEMMEKRYATLDKEALQKRKEMIEKKMEKMKNEHQKSFSQVELDVINSLLSK